MKTETDQSSEERYINQLLDWYRRGEHQNIFDAYTSECVEKDDRRCAWVESSCDYPLYPMPAKFVSSLTPSSIAFLRYLVAGITLLRGGFENWINVSRILRWQPEYIPSLCVFEEEVHEILEQLNSHNLLSYGTKELVALNQRLKNKITLTITDYIKMFINKTAARLLFQDPLICERFGKRETYKDTNCSLEAHQDLISGYVCETGIIESQPKDLSKAEEYYRAGAARLRLSRDLEGAWNGKDILKTRLVFAEKLERYAEGVRAEIEIEDKIEIIPARLMMHP